MAHESHISVGIIGHGAIGSQVAAAIRAGDAGRTRLRTILCRDYHRHADTIETNEPFLLTTDADAFFATKPDLIVEAAGQDALRKYGRRVLESGSDLLVTSIGAFTDDAFFDELVKSAETNNTRLLLASGALPALDWMSGAATSGVTKITITQMKPVSSWRGTRATELVDLDSLTEPTCFFDGTARQAATLFQKSSNITAMLALATVGLDNTKVNLYADPTRKRMQTFIEFESTVGNLRVEWQGVPSAQNRSTSAGVPLAVIKALKNLTSTVYYGL